MLVLEIHQKLNQHQYLEKFLEFHLFIGILKRNMFT